MEGLGIGTDIQAHDVTLRVTLMVILFQKKFTKTGFGKKNTQKQNTILKYLKFVEKKLDLKKDILFNNKIISARYLERKNLWKIETNKNKVFLTKYLICAVGSLSSANIPKIKGLNAYKGKYYHTGRWPKKKINTKGSSYCTNRNWIEWNTSST